MLLIQYLIYVHVTIPTILTRFHYNLQFTIYNLVYLCFMYNEFLISANNMLSVIPSICDFFFVLVLVCTAPGKT